jgi:hypothetical protein
MTSEYAKKEEENRNFFRVDDIIAVVANPVDSRIREEVQKKSVCSKAFSVDDSTDVPTGNTGGNGYENPEYNKLHDMMIEIRSKLDFVINHYLLEKEGLTTNEKKLVNISASGIRFTVQNPVKVNDIMEIKLLLPTYPPVAVLAYGEVKRVRKIDDDQYEIALEYMNMGESVKNEIIQYTLCHQRETIKKFKETQMNE